MFSHGSGEGNLTVSEVYVGLGSSLGDRRSNLERALTELDRAAGVEVIARSPIYETAPVGGPPDQPDYLNQVARLRTSLSPEQLLELTQRIERKLGRARTVRDAPRTIDVDLLLYDDLVRPQPDPVIPHPRMHQRAFVLRPLSDIAPDTVHPMLGKTIRGLLDDLADAPPVRPLVGPGDESQA